LQLINRSGALKSLITIRSWWASGLEMTWIGVIVAVVTYWLGLAFGALGNPPRRAKDIQIYLDRLGLVVGRHASRNRDGEIP
jgi:hypothetical protein